MEPMKRTIYAELFSEEMTKGDRTKANILEACIEVVTRKGYSDTRFQDIAAECGHTRTLVNHYFPTKKELFLTLAKYIRLNYQNYVLSALSQSEPTQVLDNYVQSALDWIVENPKESKIWLLFFHLATFDEDFNKLNTDLVKIGHERICSMLEQKQISNNFEIADHAKMMQIIITGCGICIISEDLTMDKKRMYVEQCKKACLELF